MTQNKAENRAESRAAGRSAQAVLGAATVANGLVAGVWYAYATSVMPALARSDDRICIEVMQNINEVIQNPVFFAGFFGALILAAVAAWQQRRSPARWWAVAALVLYAAVLLVTTAVNIPLNDELAAAGDPARIADPAAVRESFEDPWVAWNVVRLVLSTAALACLWRATALVRQTSAYLVSAAGSSASR
ncbi:anthrone oxygenase family protein [Streptomyces sp. NPDC048479]|uniref:anthrone oxygenase family protein n=1 Tax=Streptomyces sp. NPDC048479 TaxID=3154725 RepID=UPI003421F3AC